MENIPKLNAYDVTRWVLAWRFLEFHYMGRLKWPLSFHGKSDQPAEVQAKAYNQQTDPGWLCIRPNLFLVDILQGNHFSTGNNYCEKNLSSI